MSTSRSAVWKLGLLSKKDSGEREGEAETETGSPVSSLLSLEGKVHFVSMLLNNDALEGHPEIRYILMYDS